MEFSANQIAELLQGTIEGDSECCVHTLAKIEEGHKGALTFLANPKYTEYIYDTKASIAIVANDFSPEQSIPSTLTLIRVEDPYSCFAKLLDMYNSYKNQETGIHDSAIIHETAKIGTDVYVGPNVVISEGAEIGDRTKIHAQVFIGKGCRVGTDGLLHPRCSILADSLVGDHCTIHSGVILGGDGFGFAPNSENNYSKVAQIGNVIIEDHVEIGANTTIDRATLGSTIIRKGAKIDNLIQIAHNVEIGENTVIAAQTGIAGSTKIGKNVMIGGQVGIIGHIKIADGVKIAAQSGIGASIETEGQIVQGSPAVSIGDFKRSYVGFLKLPKLMTELNEIKKKFSQKY